MGLEIKTIQDIKLQELANKIDRKNNENGKIDQEEIGKLLTEMTKNKYDFQDFKNLLGADFENLSNEEKINIYQNCHSELKNSLQVAESIVKDSEEKLEKNGDTFIKGTGLIATISALLSSNIRTNFSFRNMIKGGLIGTGVGMVLTGLALFGDKAIYENNKNKCNIKNETLQQLNTEINKLKESE